MEKTEVVNVHKVELTDEQVARLKHLFEFVGLPPGPPTPECDCEACKVKMLAMVAVSKDEELFAEIGIKMIELQKGWPEQTGQQRKEGVVKFFDEVVSPRVMETLRKEIIRDNPELEKTMKEGQGQLIIGKMPDELDMLDGGIEKTPGVNMKRALA